MARLTERDYPIIANLRALGSTWGSIASVIGVSLSTVENHRMGIDAYIHPTGESTNIPNYAKTGILYISMTSSDDKVKLNAFKALSDSGMDGGSETTDIATDDNIRHDILIDLRVK